MFHRLTAPVAALLLLIAPLASATTITFPLDNFAYGSKIGDFYNGGYDSLNRLGVDYGISFRNETIKYTPRGAYLSGSVVMTLDADAIRAILGTDQYYITFNASGTDFDGSFAEILYDDKTIDGLWINGNGNPYCGVRPGACYFPYQSMDGYLVYAGGTSSPIRIAFHSYKLDNIEIHSLASGQVPVRPPGVISFELDRDIPEPASLALFGVGVTALLARRRKSRAPA